MAFNPTLMHSLGPCLCLALPVLGLLLLSEVSGNFFNHSPAEGLTITGQSPVINLICQKRAVFLNAVDQDGDGQADGAVYELGAALLVDTALSSFPDGVLFSVNQEGEEADPEATTLTLSCMDVGPNTLEVYAWRQDSIIAYCAAEIFVLSSFDLCGASNPVGISVYYYSSWFGSLSGVYDVKAYLSGDTTATAFTGIYGGSYFFGLEEGQSYLVTPFKDTGHSHNVSLFDMVLISKHILGIQLLNSPYALIAADVNNSGGVTGLDLIALRRFLLGQAAGFPNNTSWRFVGRFYVFPDPQNPWLEAFPEAASITAREFYSGMALHDYEFLAIKVGDVNGG